MANDQLLRSFSHSLTIKAPCETVLRAFFDHDSLAAWWHVTRSICTPRTFGCYAIEWAVSEWRDETLGRLGGTFHGTVVTFDPQHEFFVAEAYWLAPDGEPIGPMAMEVTCTHSDAGTIVHVRQSGWDESPRWSRYYEVLGDGLTVSLERLKTILEGAL